jgi:restriction system protein
MTQTVWGLHMAEIDAQAPIKGGFIGIGWAEMGNLSHLSDNREAFKARFAEVYSSVKPGAVPVKAGVLYRFVHEMSVDDVVVYPSKPDRMVNLGVVQSEYAFEPAADTVYPHRRRVRWMKSVPRADFSQSALHEIGSAITLFLVTTHAEEFLAALEGKSTLAQDVDDATADEVSTQVEESAEDFIIKRLKARLSPYDFEKFIAHLLTCMGYHARVTQRSGDGGIDVIAHRDELGFEPPIIKVQCKQTLEQTGRPAVQQLHGAIEQGEHGLFVTLGSFSPDARTYERSKPNLRLIDSNELIGLIYSHYDSFDPSYKVLLPLRKTYSPSPSD